MFDTYFKYLRYLEDITIYFKIMCKLCLCGLGRGALESLNKEDNKSSDAIEGRVFAVRMFEKEVPRRALYLEIQLVLYLLRET